MRILLASFLLCANLSGRMISGNDSAAANTSCGSSEAKNTTYNQSNFGFAKQNNLLIRIVHELLIDMNEVSLATSFLNTWYSVTSYEGLGTVIIAVLVAIVITSAVLGRYAASRKARPEYS